MVEFAENWQVCVLINRLLTQNLKLLLIESSITNNWQKNSMKQSLESLKKIYSSLKGNIPGNDHADMQLIS